MRYYASYNNTKTKPYNERAAYSTSKLKHRRKKKFVLTQYLDRTLLFVDIYDLGVFFLLEIVAASCRNLEKNRSQVATY